jgi:hypothetical protein
MKVFAFLGKMIDLAVNAEITETTDNNGVAATRDGNTVQLEITEKDYLPYVVAMLYDGFRDDELDLAEYKSALVLIGEGNSKRKCINVIALADVDGKLRVFEVSDELEKVVSNARLDELYWQMCNTLFEIAPPLR